MALYKFDSIYDANLYKNSSILLVLGRYNVFNNIAIRQARETCKPREITKYGESLLSEFGVEQTGIADNSSEYILGLEEFISTVQAPRLDGKWYCNVVLEVMSDKQKRLVSDYIKSPNKNGIMCINSTSFRDYAGYLKNGYIAGSKNVNIIQLSFPRKSELIDIVSRMFKEAGIKAGFSTIEMFVTRMSNSYEQYTNMIDKIALSIGKGHTEVSYEQVADVLAGFENYAIEDFINRLVIPMTADRKRGRAAVYKMMYYLINEYGAKGLASRLAGKINELIEFRIHINNGLIPVLVKGFNIAESKRRIGEKERICLKSDYQFNRLAILASKTSLLDWMAMKSILYKYGGMAKEEEYVQAIFELVVRSILPIGVMNNVIGTDNIFKAELRNLDSIIYE